MRRYGVVLILLSALALAACSGGGPSTGTDEQAGAGNEPEPTPVFDDGFDTGGTEEWSEEEVPKAPDADEEGSAGSE